MDQNATGQFVQIPPLLAVMAVFARAEMWYSGRKAPCNESFEMPYSSIVSIRLLEQRANRFYGEKKGYTSHDSAK